MSSILNVSIPVSSQSEPGIYMPPYLHLWIEEIDKSLCFNSAQYSGIVNPIWLTQKIIQFKYELRKGKCYSFSGSVSRTVV